MDERTVNAFYEQHKMKIGKDYRLEVLKMSKEDIYDYLDWRHGDNVHEWRQALSLSESKVKRLQKELSDLIKKRDFFIENNPVKPLI
jgi:hypothetical protein